MGMTKEQRKEYARQYRIDNREKLNAYARDYWKTKNTRLRNTAYRKRATARSAERKDRRLYFLNTIKLGRGCLDCGYNKHHSALEFDHVRGAKLDNISKLLGANIVLLAREVAKCDVVCANCHRIRTEQRRGTL